MYQILLIMGKTCLLYTGSVCGLASPSHTDLPPHQTLHLTTDHPLQLTIFIIIISCVLTKCRTTNSVLDCNGNQQVSVT